MPDLYYSIPQDERVYDLAAILTTQALANPDVVMGVDTDILQAKKNEFLTARDQFNGSRWKVDNLEIEFRTELARQIQAAANASDPSIIQSLIGWAGDTDIARKPGEMKLEYVSDRYIRFSLKDRDVEADGFKFVVSGQTPLVSKCKTVPLTQSGTLPSTFPVNIQAYNRFGVGDSGLTVQLKKTVQSTGFETIPQEASVKGVALDNNGRIWSITTTNVIRQSSWEGSGIVFGSPLPTTNNDKNAIEVINDVPYIFIENSGDLKCYTNVNNAWVQVGGTIVNSPTSWEIAVYREQLFVKYEKGGYVSVVTMLGDWFSLGTDIVEVSRSVLRVFRGELYLAYISTTTRTNILKYDPTTGWVIPAGYGTDFSTTLGNIQNIALDLAFSPAGVPYVLTIDTNGAGIALIMYKPHGGAWTKLNSNALYWFLKGRLVFCKGKMYAIVNDNSTTKAKLYKWVESDWSLLATSANSYTSIDAKVTIDGRLIFPCSNDLTDILNYNDGAFYAVYI